MRIQYENEFVRQLGMSDPTKRIYQLIYHEKESVDIDIIQYFIMNGL